MSDLLPCPFCGGEAYIRADASHSTASFIGCDTLGCFGYMQWDETEEGAIAAWNTRHDASEKKQQESYGIPDFP